jgi:hypothetical protein
MHSPTAIRINVGIPIPNPTPRAIWSPRDNPLPGLDDSPPDGDSVGWINVFVRILPLVSVVSEVTVLATVVAIRR